MTKAYIDKMPDMCLTETAVMNWRIFFNQIARKVAEAAYHQGLEDMYNKLNG